MEATITAVLERGCRKMNNDPTQQQTQVARKKLVDYGPILIFVIPVIFGAGILFNQVQTLQNSLDDLSQDIKEQKKTLKVFQAWLHR